MPRWLKVTLITVPAALAALAIALWIAIASIDPKTLVSIASERVKAATGRELAVRGPIQLSIWPLAIIAEGVVFGNAPWGTRPEMLTIQRVEARVQLLPLLRQRVELAELRLVKPDLVLETARDGRVNWVLGGAPGAGAHSPAGESAEIVPIVVADRVRLEDGRVAWRDGASGRTTTLAIHVFSLSQAAKTAPADYALEASFRDTRFAVAASTAAPEAWAAGGEHPIRIALSTAGAKLVADGTVRALSPLTAEGKVELDVQATEALSRLLGSALALPLPMRGTASVSIGERGQVYEALSLVAMDQRLQGRLEWRTDGPRPLLRGDLHASELDLRKLQARSPAGAAPSTAATAQAAAAARAPTLALLPLVAIRAIDAEGSLRVDRLVTESGAVLDRVSVRFTQADSRLRADPVEFGLEGGRISARVIADATPGRTPTLGLRAQGSELNGGAIAKSLGAGVPLTGAPASFTLDLAGPADSLAGFRAGVSGNVRVQVGRGTIGAVRGERSNPFDQLMHTVIPVLGAATSATELICAVARVEIRGGVATSRRSVAIETDKVNAVLSGTLRLADERLDLAVRPSVRKGIPGVPGLVEVVRVRGTLSEPRIEVDTLDAARAALTLGAAAQTGGLSLLAQTLFGRAAEDPAPCRTALAGGVREPSAEPGSAPRAEEAPTVKDLGDAVRRLFRR